MYIFHHLLTRPSSKCPVLSYTIYNQTLYAFIFSPRTTHALSISSHVIWCLQLFRLRVKIMKFLIMQLIPASWQLLSLKSKHSKRPVVGLPPSLNGSMTHRVSRGLQIILRSFLILLKFRFRSTFYKRRSCGTGEARHNEKTEVPSWSSKQIKTTKTSLRK